MGMNTFIVGFRPPNEKWLAMKKIWDACKAAGIDEPKEVWEFFNHENPDNAGVRIQLESHESVTPYHEDMIEGFEVDLTKLPKDVTKIRFWNSW